MVLTIKIQIFKNTLINEDGGAPGWLHRLHQTFGFGSGHDL